MKEDAPTAAVRLDTKLQNDVLTLVAKVRVGKADERTFEIGPISDSVKTKFYAGLLAFQNGLEPIRNDVRTTAEALETLWTAGGKYGDGLVDIGTWRKLCDLLEQVIPESDTTDRLPPIVEIAGRALSLTPFELLPLLERRFPKPVTTEEELYRAAGSFLGFAAVVRRLPQVSYSTPPALSGSPLPVTLFRDGAMRGARMEERFFNGDARVSLQTAWPAAQTNDMSAAALISRLVDPSAQLDGKTPAADDQIQHFACHCYLDEANELTIRLGLQTTSCEISYQDLRKNFQGSRPERTLPLLFMNACGTAVVPPETNASFPRLFLGNGNRGFIGTHTLVPDSFAARFSRVFYEHLLQGSSVAAALWRARWRMLHRYKNPLGILYTLYSDPELARESDQAMTSGGSI
jgi:hypothetical protein